MPDRWVAARARSAPWTRTARPGAAEPRTPFSPLPAFRSPGPAPGRPAHSPRLPGAQHRATRAAQFGPGVVLVTTCSPCADATGPPLADLRAARTGREAAAGPEPRPPAVALAALLADPSCTAARALCAGDRTSAAHLEDGKKPSSRAAVDRGPTLSPPVDRAARPSRPQGDATPGGDASTVPSGAGGDFTVGRINRGARQRPYGYHHLGGRHGRRGEHRRNRERLRRRVPTRGPVAHLAARPSTGPPQPP